MPRGHKGEAKTPGSGRKKGSQNKATVEIKEMIRGALDESGGQAYLTKQAFVNPVAFMGLIGKIIPADVNNKLTGNFTISWKK